MSQAIASESKDFGSIQIDEFDHEHTGMQSSKINAPYTKQFTIKNTPGGLLSHQTSQVSISTSENTKANISDHSDQIPEDNIIIDINNKSQEVVEEIQIKNENKKEQKNTLSGQQNIMELKKAEFSKAVQKIEEIEKKARFLYTERVIDQAIKLKADILKKLEELKSEFQENQFKEEFNKIQTRINPLLEDIEFLYQDVIQTTQLLEIQEGWIVEKDKNKIQVAYRQQEKSDMITLKITAQVDICIKNLIALVYEVELYSKWLPFCKFGKKLKKIDLTSQVAHLHFNLPVISNREVYLYGVGIDRVEKNGKMLIVVHSIDENEQFKKKFDINEDLLPKKSKNVRVDVPFFVFEVSPNPNGKGLNIVAIGNFDAKLQFIPSGMVNFILRKFSYLMFQKMFEMGSEKKFKGSAWEKNVENNPEFYDWVGNKFEKYYNSNQQQENKNNDDNSELKASKKK